MSLSGLNIIQNIPGPPGSRSKATSLYPDGIPFYGQDATKEKGNFSTIVVHHTAASYDSAVSFDRIPTEYTNYETEIIDGKKVRKGYFTGYHFIIKLNGQIVQVAPLSVRTNHSKAELIGGDSSPFNNRRAIGVSFESPKGEFEPSGEQRISGLKLIGALMKKFGIQPDMIKGHHETDRKDHNEGKWIKDAIRYGELDPYYKRTTGEKIRDASSAAGSAAFLLAIIFGGIYGWKKYIKPRLGNFMKAERVLSDSQRRVIISKFRAANKVRIAKARYDADLAKQLQKELYALL